MSVSGLPISGTFSPSPTSPSSYTFTPSAVLADGNYEVKVRAGNVAGVTDSTVFRFAVDTSAPVAPSSIALQSDTGISNSDRITSLGALTVSGVEQGARLEYSSR
ncbi:MAG: hypothetical protein EB072_01805 [Betaproteobacteria bacterium]|nr:hypothetical protein [Betaproteobacteria bacterium]